MRSKPPVFEGYEADADNGFDRARTQIATPFQFAVIALDTATANKELICAGNFLYCDTGSTGVIQVELNTQHDANPTALTMQAGFAINAPFTRVRISWASQAGKSVTLFWSTDASVVPNGVISSINSIINPVTVNDTLGASVQHTQNLLNNGIGTTITPIFLPGANPNGAIIRGIRGGMASGAGGNSESGLIAAASAPTNLSSKANAILLNFFFTANAAIANFDQGQMNRRIPANWGLWLVDIVAVAADSGFYNSEYELL